MGIITKCSETRLGGVWLFQRRRQINFLFEVCDAYERVDGYTPKANNGHLNA